MIDTTSKVDGGSEDSVCASSAYRDSDGGEIVKKDTQNKKRTEDVLAQIHREKQRLLMEANMEKDKRLEQLEKEMNDLNIQHKEGIYWLRLQLETSRREKSAADERIAELQKDLRRLSSDQPPRNISLDPTIADSVGNGDEKDDLITRLESRVEKYERTFEVMENQMAMVKSSSGEVIKTLKEEIASLMEDRTRAELDLLNQLSELDNENRRRQLEYALELHNKNETIETLRNLECSSMTAEGPQISSLWTLVDHSSSSTEDTKSSTFGRDISSSNQASDVFNGEDQADQDQSSLVLRLEEEKIELQRKLDKANKELNDLRSGLNVKNSPGSVVEEPTDLQGVHSKDDPELVQRLSEERRGIDASMDRVKTILGSTETTLSNLKGLIETLKPDGDSGAARPKERILSVLEDASLIHEEAKLSILLTELKLRNEFECLEKNLLLNEITPEKQELINDMKEIRNDALVELGKVETEFSSQISDLEKRTMWGISKLSDLLQKGTNMRAKELQTKSNTSNQIPVSDGLPGVVSSCQTDHDSRGESATAGDGLMISRDVLRLLEKELLQFAERIRAKNKKIVFLKDEVERHKIREGDLRKELWASIKLNADMNQNERKTSKNKSSKSHKVKKKDEKMDAMSPKKIPREIRTSTEGIPATSEGASPKSILTDKHKKNTKLKREISRGGKGMSDNSQEGGTNPISPIPSCNRHASIGFIPSPRSPGKNICSNSTSPKKLTKEAYTRRQPDSREIKKLVFLPPCFFSDLDDYNQK